MLTQEILKQSTELAGLTDAQLAAIETLSKNDETAVIGKRIGELHGQYDADILAVTGIAKNDGEKSYDYNKRILAAYKERQTADEKKFNEAQTTIADLNAKIAAGSQDETLKQSLKDSQLQVTQLQTQIKTLTDSFATEKAKLQADVTNTKVDFIFKAAQSGIKFKSSIPESARPILLDAAKREVLAMGTPSFNEDGTMVFRDKDGNILTNTANGLNPYTVEELLRTTSIKDSIDTGKKQPGAGTKVPQGKTELLDMTGVTTQVEANERIEKYLLSQGLTRDSREFADKLLELYKENNISNLPITKKL